MASSRQFTRSINGHSTELLVQAFADRILVLVTQMGKIGTLIQATIPDSIPLLQNPELSEPYPNQDIPLPSPSPAIQLTTLLGTAPSEHMRTLYSLYAAQIAMIVWTQESNNVLELPRRSVVVGLALRRSNEIEDSDISESEKHVFRSVMSMLYEK